MRLRSSPGTGPSEDEVLAALQQLAPPTTLALDALAPDALAPDEEFRRATRARLVAMAAVRTPARRGPAVLRRFCPAGMRRSPPGGRG